MIKYQCVYHDENNIEVTEIKDDSTVGNHVASFSRQGDSFLVIASHATPLETCFILDAIKNEISSRLEIQLH